MLTAIISALTFMYLIGTSVVVLQKNPAKAINISLAVGVLFIGLWLIGVAALPTSLGTHTVYGRFLFAVAPVGIEGLFLFILLFAKAEGLAIRFLNRPRLSLIITAFISVLALTPQVIRGVAPSSSGTIPQPIYGGLYRLYLLLILALGLGICAQLLYVYVQSRGRLRAQAQVMLFGTFLFIVAVSLSNAVLPTLTHSVSAVMFMPLSAIVLAFALSYAVLKHGLFDIRFFVVRASIYSLSSILLGILYLAPILYVMILILGFKFIPLKFTIALVVAIIAASLYGAIRHWFDQKTKLIFFRDMYDPEQFIGELNKSIVTNLNIDSMLNAAAKVIIRNLKIESCTFALTSGYDTRIVGIDRKKVPENTVREIDNMMRKNPSGIIAADAYSGESNKFYRLLRENDFALVGRLAGEAKHTEPYGYILLGAKKSGVIYTKQDLRMLEAIIDGLIVAIQNALRFEEIQNFNLTLQRTVDEKTRQLKRTNDKLVALDETKDDFISMASHQLRTPLTSVKGYLSMVLDEDAGPVTPMQRKMLDQAFVSSQRMVYLIADLLNVSRLRTGKFVIDPVRTNLAKLVSDEIKQLQETAKSHALKLDFIKPAAFPDLMLDETKIRQVIMNFIDNAIYYTPSGGKITVELVDTPVSIKLFVRDTGIGVPRSEQQHLFTKFYRAGNARRARPDGTGLGLFMAKKVVMASGGSVVFESKEGEGSTFGFIFAKERLAVPAPAVGRPSLTVKNPVAAATETRKPAASTIR